MLSDEAIISVAEWAVKDALDAENYHEAMRLLKPLAAQGSMYALSTLAWIHTNGPSDFVDKNKTRQCLETLVSMGSLEGHLEYGWYLIGEKRLSEARDTLERGRETGGGSDFDETLGKLLCYEAEIAASSAIEKGDYWQAFTVLNARRKCKSAYIQATLGWLYEMGLGVRRDSLTARSFYKQANELGCSDASYRLGRLELEEGNEADARSAFLRGAQIDHLPSISKLAEMLVDGIGGPVDFEAGRLAWLKAAAQGHIVSKLKLLKLEIKMTKNPLVRAGLALKLIPILIAAQLELSNGDNSQSLYELLGPTAPER